MMDINWCHYGGHFTIHANIGFFCCIPKINMSVYLNFGGGGGGGSKITAYGVCSHEIKTLTPWKKSYDQPRQHIKKHRHYFANKGLSSQGYDFPSSHVWM